MADIKTVVDTLSRERIVPVAVIENASDAPYIAEALIGSGINNIEVTFRTVNADKAIELIKKAFPDMTVGAGTVLDTEALLLAQRAGADFVVAPGTNPTVVKRALELGIFMIPGVCTPSETELALSLGLSVLKFFPAEAAGGVKMIRALSAPYSMVKWMPTGGIDAENIRDYLAVPSVFACGGSFMLPKKALLERDFKKIESLAMRAREIIA